MGRDQKAQRVSQWIYGFSNVMAQPISFIILGAAGIIAAALGLLLDMGEVYMTVVNLSISLLTMIIGQAVLVSSGRDGIALHLKLDRIIEAQPSDNDAIGAEHKDAEEIEQERNRVEARASDEDNFVVIPQKEPEATAEPPPRRRRRRRQD